MLFVDVIIAWEKRLRAKKIIPIFSNGEKPVCEMGLYGRKIVIKIIMKKKMEIVKIAKKEEDNGSGSEGDSGMD